MWILWCLEKQLRHSCGHQRVSFNVHSISLEKTVLTCWEFSAADEKVDTTWKGTTKRTIKFVYHCYTLKMYLNIEYQGMIHAFRTSINKTYKLYAQCHDTPAAWLMKQVRITKDKHSTYKSPCCEISRMTEEYAHNNLKTQLNYLTLHRSSSTNLLTWFLISI